MSANGLLKMRELAEASGVSAGTIKHYLREGLLPEPVKTSRNMAYYPPEFVERIRLIKQLQEERFMPLKLIKSMLEEDPDRARALVELEDRILERALAGEQARTSAAELRRRYDVPQEVLDRLAELEVISPNSRGYGPSDVEIVEAISRFRAGGYDERIGFTVYDTLRYKSALEQLVKEEVQVLLERLAGEMDTDRAVELIEAGAEPLRDLIAALHQKSLVAELRRQAGARLVRDDGAGCLPGAPSPRTRRSPRRAGCGASSERVHVDLAREVAVDELGHLVAALDAAEGRARHAPARDQEARDDVERLALAGHAGDRAEPPAHARRLDGLAHHRDVAGRLERVVGAEAAGLLEDALDDVVAADQQVGRALAARLGSGAPRRGRSRRSARRRAGGSRPPRPGRPGRRRRPRRSSPARPGRVQRRADAGR